MGITGITSSKLFKVKTTDLSDPYKVGVNGVLSIFSEGIDGADSIEKEITYLIDDIIYKTTIDVKQVGGYSFQSLEKKSSINISVPSKKRASIKEATIIEQSKNGSKMANFFKLDRTKGVENINQKTLPLSFNINPNTTFITNQYSYNHFISEDVYKESDYVGLIGKPIIKSEIFMERDKGSIFERHQRLSEINSINELETYKNGYYENINTI